MAGLNPADHPETLAFDKNGSDGLEIYDACAMAAWLAPELLTVTACHVSVDEVGRTLCDLDRADKTSAINCYVGASPSQSSADPRIRLRCTVKKSKETL